MATELTPDQERRLEELLRVHTVAKGWDTGSVVLGFAFGCGLTMDEARARASETKYYLMALGRVK